MSLSHRIHYADTVNQPNIGYRYKDGKWQVIEYTLPQYNKKHWTKMNAGFRRKGKVLQEFKTQESAAEYAEKIRNEGKANGKPTDTTTSITYLR